MILDRLDSRKKSAGMGHGIPEALEYLAKTDFSTLADGKHVIDGERLFAMVQRYKVKPVSDARWEMHRRYLDVQYIACGGERIGYAPLEESTPVEEAYDAARDAAFYAATGVLLPVSAGMFAIFAPEEIHAPCLAPAEPEPAGDVVKVVMKCRWDE